MTTLAKLAAYEAALRKWTKARDEHDVANGSERPEPTAAQHGLRSAADKWAAQIVRERVMGK